MSDINPKWDEYILWLATPEHERGAVANEEQWAKANGFANARTTRRWRSNPEFLERQKTLTSSMVAKVGAVAVFETDKGTIDADERDYKVVKNKLVESAKGGSLKAQELFMKLYGKSWLDEEMASRASDFSNLELPDLIAKAVDALDPATMVKVLEEKGYTVKGPE